MRIIQKAALLFPLMLAACGTYEGTNHTAAAVKASTGFQFTYTAPNGSVIDLNKIEFKTDGMVRLENPDVLGVGGTTYVYTRYGAWNSRVGRGDVFAFGHAPSTDITLEGDQVYYGRALRATSQSVYDNRLTFMLNFNTQHFKGFSVSPPNRRTFGEGILMDGQLKDGGFSGTVESGKNNGRFSGQFYGPNGAEFIGIARFDNPSLDFSFGGDVQTTNE